MSANTLRKKYMRGFANMDRYSRAVAWVVVVGYLSQIALSVAAGGYLLSQPLTWMSGLVAAMLMLFIGTRMRGLNNIIHECSHSTFSTDRSDNVAIGKLCAALLFGSFYDYRDEHLSHHSYLGDYDRDMDLHGIEDLKLHEPLSARVVLRHLVTPIIGRHLPYYLGLNFSNRDGVLFLFVKTLILLAVSTSALLFPLTTVLFVILPFVLIYSALNYWADCLDHAGIVAAQDDLYASRNVLAPRILRALFFPRSDCFHLVHHLFPHVPTRHLESSHKVLMSDALYRSNPHAVLGRDRVDVWPEKTNIPAE